MPRGDERVDERRSAALDVSLPLVALLLVGTVAMLVLGDVSDRAHHMGWWFFVVSGAAVAAVAGTSTLLWLRRRGSRVPVSVTLLFATLPWLTGLGGLRFGMHRVEQALERSEWSSHGLIASVGYAEASASAAYGAILSAALLSATAIVLAVRTEHGARSRALTPTVVVLVAIACVGPAMAIADVGAASMMLPPLVAALVAFVASAGRVGAPGVAIAVFLATVAACSATTIDALGGSLHIFGGVGSADRRDVLEQAAVAHHVLVRAAWIAIGAIGLAALILVAESARRAQRSFLGRAIALVVIAVSVLALHRVSTLSATRTIEAWTSLPWQHVDGFVLVRTPNQWASEPWVVVSADGVIQLGETTLPSEGAALREAIEEENRRREEIEREQYEEEETPEWVDALDEEPAKNNRYEIGAPSDESEPEPRLLRRFWERPSGVVEGCAIGGLTTVSAAIDTRVSAMSLFDLLDVSGQLTIVGRGGDEVPDTSRELAALANIAERDSLGQFAVSTPPGTCDPNPGNDILLTTILGMEPVVLRDYETGAEMTIPSDLDERRTEQPNALIFVFVRPVEGVTVQHLADLARLLDETAEFRLVLVRELPELPPIAPLPNEVADEARDARVTLGPVYPSGALSREALEERRSEFDLCAQRALTAAPDVAGDMQVLVRIGPDGRAQSVRTVGANAALRPMRACVMDVVQGWTFTRDEATRVMLRVTLGEEDL